MGQNIEPKPLTGTIYSISSKKETLYYQRIGSRQISPLICVFAMLLSLEKYFCNNLTPYSSSKNK